MKKELRSGISELRHVKCQVAGLQQFVHWLFGAEKQMAWAINGCDFCFEYQFLEKLPPEF